MDKSKFIAETSAKILSSMFANTEKVPDVAIAVEFAIGLWEELENSGCVSEE